ncbi:hypothetical protein VTH82DRAFT_8484 [Thermothelomyces myriococcoides]
MMNRAATSVTITDPFVKYTSLIATGVYCPDAAQYRLAHHLQKVYLRLKDYAPSHEYQSRLRQIAKMVEASGKGRGDELASPTHPIRRNPLFSRFFQSDEGKDSTALTRVMTSYQAALHVDSPKGLFLSGEVGTGKSMLLDLLAEGLPTHRKRRWHFNTFMLHTFSRLEEFRKSRSREAADSPEHSLLWMAKELVETSPILFLDEFQLPDRAASKIMSNLFVAFFQLGGVLVASSNRMPEELEKAAGGYYSPPATGGLVDRILGFGRSRFSGELFGRSSDFAAFLEVLKARCDFWHMEGTRDWRRRESRPADYITLACNYHTFIIDHVPVLNLSMKNEARRFITLLDALYEARCKLVIRAEAGPDDLFFPETRTRPADIDGVQPANGENDGTDATYSETIAEVFQDQVSPFRPNVSTYSESSNSKYDPDQDSDFGKEQGRKIDFSNTSAFTGEDERFAYKRATSRLWELCSAQWHSRTGQWWQPLPKEARHWEGAEPSKPPPSPLTQTASSEITMGASVELEEPAGLERFRIAALKKVGQDRNS